MKLKDLLLIAFVVSFMNMVATSYIPLIGTGTLTCFAVLPFTGLSVDASDTDDLNPVNRTMQKIRAGADAGKALNDILAAKETSTFFGTIGKIAKHLGPFLGAIGPLFGFLDFFFPKGPSPELQYMVKEFKQINERFDKLFYGIDDLEALIVIDTVKVQYGDIQATVFALSDQLGKIIEAKANNQSNETINARIEVFTSLFDKIPVIAKLDKLYEGMMEVGGFLTAIPPAIRQYTHDDRLKTQNMMKNALSVLLKGVKVLLAYDQIKGDNITYQDQQKEWIDKIQKVTTVMQNVDRDIVKKWSDQLRHDVDRILTEKKDLSNEDFIEHLYKFLTSKYDWRDWYVVVYNPITGEDKHYSNFTKDHAFTWMNEKGRNVIITSEIKRNNSGVIDHDHVLDYINKIELGKEIKTPFFWGHSWEYVRHNARQLYDANFKNFPHSCEHEFRNMGSGVILWASDPRYRAPEGKSVVKGRDHYVFHVFGYCANPRPASIRHSAGHDNVPEKPDGDEEDLV